MGGFQRGDTCITIDNHVFVLRLTMGALAEINDRLRAGGPLELAKKLKSFSSSTQARQDARVLLECLLRPAYPSCGEDISVLSKKANPDDFMPAVAILFERNLCVDASRG